HRSKILQLFGEAACDAMLAKLARIVRRELRREDPFARWDEDGFILMLSQTDRLSGLEIAERLRLEIADASLLPQRPVTVSIGLVQSQSAEQLDHLLARLASCHGQAKREHNAVVG
ncbi:diguanylate cyclase domain-containing protein, partial [Aeromonas caviae]